MFRTFVSSGMLRALAPGIPPVTPSVLDFKHAITYPRGVCSTGAEPVEHKIGLNDREEEEILFKGQNPPQGYTYVRPGDRYVTRHCRSLAKERGAKIYVFIRSRSRRHPGGPYGFYVPSWILSMVINQNDLRQKMHNKKLTRWLYKTYPRMPSKDMAEIQEHFLSPFAKTSSLPPTITEYVLSGYTAFDSLRSGDEKRSMARQEANEIIKTWRGE